MTAPAGSGPVAIPAGLTHDTLLPFALWRVLHHVDGQRGPEEIAALSGLPVQQVLPAVAQAAAWANRAAQRSRPVTEEALQAVTQCVITVVGPMGEFLVEDVLDELGEGAMLGTLLSKVAAQLSEAQVQGFVQQLRARGLA